MLWWEWTLRAQMTAWMQMAQMTAFPFMPVQGMARPGQGEGLKLAANENVQGARAPERTSSNITYLKYR